MTKYWLNVEKQLKCFAPPEKDKNRVMTANWSQECINLKLLSATKKGKLDPEIVSQEKCQCDYVQNI